MNTAARITAIALSLALTACASSTPAGRPTSPATPLEQYRAWIHDARLKHPYAESEARMYAVMMCESGGRPLIVNPAGPYTGLFQYVDRTWNDTWNIYRARGIKNPEAQILATALAWSLNKQSHWGCYRKTAATQ
jgi:hypothetical protein